MSRHITSLDSIHVESPSEADWDSMRGNEQVRFCEHCRRSVYNLSEMTRHEALRLVRNSDGRLCMRYVRPLEDTDKSFALPAELYRITRRASRLAAGAFTAVLSLAAAAAAQTTSSGGDSTVAATEIAVPENMNDNKTDRTVLMFLTEASSADIVRSLIKAGARVNLKDDDGDTALMRAASLEESAILQFLIEEKAKVNDSNKSGETALMKAAEDGLAANVRALVMAGADVNFRDNDGETALSRALYDENEEIVEMLKSFGATQDFSPDDESTEN
ncbi:MAG: ankyrin repeat domain-containing protein [Pyrinomonadaceae bacterium]|nr:ankyrin repeat domain-containing protein [Pyrinomonadaceae bacterium]